MASTKKLVTDQYTMKTITTCDMAITIRASSRCLVTDDVGTVVSI